MKKHIEESLNLLPISQTAMSNAANSNKATSIKKPQNAPENAGKAIRLPVPDFSDSSRPLSCLEVDFPIASINALSDLEGNAGKPIYQMSKWWARRRSSVFRAMLIAAATQAPEDSSQAAKLVWEHYYCNHQKAGSFKKLKVLDCFMGGGTTLVEGSRLGMQMTGVDLNPVAWLVVKNELACSDPEQVKALFAEIEKKVKPQIQPFYTTTCPRGHKGRWLDERTGREADVDPIKLPPEERVHYRWEGPEVIYTFWAKHGPCQATGCGYRTPLFKSPIIAEKSLSTQYLDLTCPHCNTHFHVDLGETRMAPGVERVILDDEPLFTEMAQATAKLFKDYDKGNVQDTWERADKLKNSLPDESSLICPNCGKFAANSLLNIVNHHAESSTNASQRKKKAFDIKTKKVQMRLLIHPEWLKGTAGYDENGEELGGYAGADPDKTAQWYEKRSENLKLVEIRGQELPDEIKLADGMYFNLSKATMPKDAHYICASCGRDNVKTESLINFGHSAPEAVYAMQCYCPTCSDESYTYNGRYFKIPNDTDIAKFSIFEHEWENRRSTDLANYWPKMEIPYSMRTHVKDPLPLHGYTHWWKMFNSRQLLIHSQFLKVIIEAYNKYSLDVIYQVLGTFIQHLRMMCMFSFWHQRNDTLAPALSNSNYNPKNHPVETNVYGHIGYGRFISCGETVNDALMWCHNPWEQFIGYYKNTKSEKIFPGDPIIPGTEIYCSSSSDLSVISENEKYDLIITDPPFGDNLFYADLADFFYVWLRIAMLKWCRDVPENELFRQERTPHSMEAIDNPVEHPDDREEWEKEIFISKKNLAIIRKITGDNALEVKDPNPLYRKDPSSEFYSQTLAACWSEAGKRLKDGGILAFTFHHNEDSAWIDVLQALFEAGYLLVATYPIKSDETKGENASFGSQKIEYDIIHVCRKRLEEPEPVAWVKMRRWVKEEAERLKELLEQTHGKALPESDLRVILRGKSLEFYSRHYGKVFTGEGQVLDVRDALLGINQLLDDILDSSARDNAVRPPDSAEPASRLFLNIFRKDDTLGRDDLHKRLRGTGFSQADFEARGWARMVGKSVQPIPIQERFEFFTSSGRNRKVIKSDLDQAIFCIGAVLNSLKLDKELDNPNFKVKKSVDDILAWFVQVTANNDIRRAAHIASELLARWRTRTSGKKLEPKQGMLFEYLEENAS